MVDARDLKSLEGKTSCGFDSHPRHFVKTFVLTNSFTNIFLKSMSNEIYNKPIYSQKTAFWVGLSTVGLIFFLLVLVLYFALRGGEEIPREANEVTKQEEAEVVVEEESQPEEGIVAGESVAPVAPQTYVVQSGDTLFEIGLKFKVDWRSIAEANGIEDQGALRAGQTLTIPAQ